MKHLLVLSAVVLSLTPAMMASAGDTGKATGKDARKIVTIRKTQAVDFEGDTVDGQARHPEGSYLVQKRSVDFVPLYKVRERFDENIKNSIDYLK